MSYRRVSHEDRTPPEGTRIDRLSGIICYRCDKEKAIVLLGEPGVVPVCGACWKRLQAEKPF